MSKNLRIIVFTGAGVSAESGISTFRDSDGLWDKYRIEDVCTPEALLKNRHQVIEFYNIRRAELLTKQPNAAHLAIKELEKHFDVQVITQNIDDLHERAGSTKVTHLHGELLKLRSSRDESLVFTPSDPTQDIDDKAPDGSLARPFVVFFGEAVPEFENAAKIARSADIFIVVGTSLAVYPAASLLNFIREGIPVYLVDPNNVPTQGISNPIEHIKMGAASGMPLLSNKLINIYKK